MTDITKINRFLQDKLNHGNFNSVNAVEAAEWLDRAGLLRDSADRPGLPLRKLLREGQILGQRQDPPQKNGRWFIYRVTDETGKSASLAGRSPSSAAFPTHSADVSPRTDVLPDILANDLRLVFVGTAVGDISAQKHHYYSAPNNRFYHELHDAGLTPRLLRSEEDVTLLEYGIGLTDIIKSVHTSSDADLLAADLDRGAILLSDKLRQYRPAWVGFNGKNAYQAFMGRNDAFGEALETIHGCHMFIVPSTSGRVPQTERYDGRTRSEWFRLFAHRIAIT